MAVHDETYRFPGIGLRRGAGGGADREIAPRIALACLCLAVLEAVADVLPDAPLAGVLTPLRLVILTGLVALAVSGVRRRLPWRLWRTPLDVAVLVLLLAAAVPLLSTGAWPEWRGLATSIALAYLAAGVLRGGPQVWPAVTLLALVGVGAMALTAAQQVAGGVPTGFCRGALDGSADSCGVPGAMTRAVGTFANPNLLAAALVLLLPFALAHAVSLARRAERLVAHVVVALGVVALVLTWSRAGILAIGAMLLAYLVLRRPTRRRLVAGALAVLAGVATAIGAVLLGAPVGVRAQVWVAALDLARAHPWGAGLGRSGALLAEAIPGDEAFQHAHNLWLDTLVTSGVLGLAATVAVTGVAAVVVVRGARAGSVAANATGAALAGFAVLCLLDHPANAVRVAGLLWFVLGLAVAGGTVAGGPPPQGRKAEDAAVAPGRGRTPEAPSEATGHAPAVPSGVARPSPPHGDAPGAGTLAPVGDPGRVSRPKAQALRARASGHRRFSRRT